MRLKRVLASCSSSCSSWSVPASAPLPGSPAGRSRRPAARSPFPGSSGPSRVVRDVAGIAHIRAETVHDLFMAQGFVHAQERMWQMEVWRHISAGRLAEMFGESQLDTDRFIRTLGWRQATERDLAAMAPDARAVLDAYAQGVNAWLDQERDSLGLAFL